jgi:hypothetical protein
MTVLAEPVTKRIHSLSSVLTFGKYKGLTVRAVIRFDARYFGWAVKNVPWFDLDAEARKIGQRAINDEKRFASNQQEAWAWGFGLSAKNAREKYDSRRHSIEYEERRNAGQVLDRFGHWRLKPSETEHQRGKA